MSSQDGDDFEDSKSLAQRIKSNNRINKVRLAHEKLKNDRNIDDSDSEEEPEKSEGKDKKIKVIQKLRLKMK